MIRASNWRHRWRATRLVQQRDTHAAVLGMGLYTVISLSLASSTLILRNHLSFMDEKGLLVLSGAFAVPFFVVIFVSSLFLALSSVATIARERDQGTMQVLFYGPVDSVSYILGKYLAQFVVYLVMLVVYGACFAFIAALTNFNFPLRLLLILFLSIFVASDLIAFGIFLSTLSRTVRTALLLFVSVVLVFGIIQASHQLLIHIPSQGRYYNPLLFLKNALTFLNDVTGWLSPFSYLNRGTSAIQRGNAVSYSVMLLVSSIYTGVFLGLSVLALEHRGVRK